MRSAFSRTDHEKPPALTEHRAIPVLLANQFSHEARWGRASSVREQQSGSALDDPPLGTEKVADLLCNLDVKYEYETEKVPYTIPHLYTPDFFLPNGVVLECKGYWDADDRRKIKAVKQQHPELDLRMVFQAPFNTISKKSKTTYAKWCDKHDIPWTSFHNIPIDWLL